jgi:transcriptional regulator with XRE-family HTH domain
MTIGDRIKLLRNTLELTQSEFANRLRSVQNTITGYETGRRTPSGQVIELICREFNISRDWLENGNGEMFNHLDRDEELAAWAGSILNPNNDNEFMKKFVHMLSKLNQDDWKVLEKMALSMAEENEKG